MPILQIEILKGRTVEQKRNMVKKVTSNRDVKLSERGGKDYSP